MPFEKMQRVARGLDVPQGTAGQEAAAMKCFGEFLALGNMDERSLADIAKSLSTQDALPSQNFYSLLTAFSIFLQTKPSVRGGYLAKATAIGYMSQVVNMLRERFPQYLSDSKRIAKIRDKMAAAIAERNMMTGIQTGEAPGCTLDDLRLLVQETAIKGVGSGYKSLHDAAVLTLMWHTFGRAIDTCFSRKSQLSISASGELFLRVARVKTSVVQGISIYKAAAHWEQCMLHALGMLFAGASEPSSFVFPLMPHVAASDLPGEKTYSQDEAIVYWESLEEGKETVEPAAKRVRGRPNVSKYVNDIVSTVSDRLIKSAAPMPAKITPGLSSHSLRRGAAAYANASPQLAIQWISTRGAWLLDSLTKAFAYVGTTTREDQSVGKILAGYKDPHLPCLTPSIASLKERLPDLEYARVLALRSQLFKNVSGFTDTSLNVDGAVLDAAMAALLIHLEEVLAAVTQEQKASGFTSHYLYRLHEALDATNENLGARLTLDSCVTWGRQLRTVWETDNYAQLGNAGGSGSAVLGAAITQILSSIGTMQQTLHKLVSMQEEKSACNCTARTNDTGADASCVREPSREDVIAESHSLAGCWYNWYTLELWNTATEKKQQFARADLKACVNVMMIAAGRDINVPSPPLDRDGVSYRMWKQELWTLAEDLDRKTNKALGSIDRKGNSKTAGSLRKRWRNLRLKHRPEYDALCSAFITRKASNTIVDHFTPDTHLWRQKDLE